MQSTFLVMAGGALGAAMRYHLSRWMLHGLGPAYPFGTLAANILGGLAMGLLFGLVVRTGAPDGWRLFAGVGVLGGFTTFSAFSLEMVGMIEQGALVTALSYALLSVVGAAGALFLGLTLARMVTA